MPSTAHKDINDGLSHLPYTAPHVPFSKVKDAVAYVVDEPSPSGCARHVTFTRVLAQLGARSLNRLTEPQRAEVSTFEPPCLPRLKIMRKAQPGAYS